MNRLLQEIKMKGTFKTLTAVAILAALAGCSSYHKMEYSDTDLIPKWSEDCKQAGSEGWLFWKTDYAYSCGSGRSWDKQASEAQAKLFAMKGYAERINGTVNASTTIDITDSGRETRTFAQHLVRETTIREHLEVKKFTYVLTTTGEYHTYYRYKMPLEVFNNLIAEAKNEQRIRLNNSTSN